MYVGPDRKSAVEQARANAASDGQPRYLHIWNGAYWIDKQLPQNAACEIIYPDGHTVRTRDK